MVFFFFCNNTYQYVRAKHSGALKLRRRMQSILFEQDEWRYSWLSIAGGRVSNDDLDCPRLRVVVTDNSHTTVWTSWWPRRYAAARSACRTKALLATDAFGKIRTRWTLERAPGRSGRLALCPADGQVIRHTRSHEGTSVALILPRPYPCPPTNRCKVITFK